MQPTNPNQFTEKAWQAIVRTPEIAKEAKHQQIESEHLMKALVEQEGLGGFGVQQSGSERAKSARSRHRIHQQTAQNQQLRAGRSTSASSLDKLLDRADGYRKDFGDELHLHRAPAAGLR
jgi:ATP-dependent Clp protease ATP-binding subunit ClpB